VDAGERSGFRRGVGDFSSFFRRVTECDLLFSIVLFHWLAIRVFLEFKLTCLLVKQRSDALRVCFVK